MTRTYFEAEDYRNYFEEDFRHRWLRPDALEQKLKKFRSSDVFRLEELGQSIEGRSISSIKYGNGSRKIVMWTQMHGNEPTATMAVVDLLNFLSSDDKYNGLRNAISENLEITIIPMLNPDGAERFRRRNALNIDLNRDAARHTMPELKVLTNWVEIHKPEWAFNLHDQRNIFTVGETSKSATISFLAASADVSKTLTPTRIKSMNLIAELADLVESQLPGHVGKYTDEFYPRALGEFFHKNEIPCVLIESGAYKNDPFRDQARRMNFLSIIEGLAIISNDRVPEERVERYKEIPENTTNMLDLIVRDCTLTYEGNTFEADLGLLIKESISESGDFLRQQFILQDIGDLNFHYAFKDIKGGVVHFAQENLLLEKPANFSIKLEDGSELKFDDGMLPS